MSLLRIFVSMQRDRREPQTHFLSSALGRAKGAKLQHFMRLLLPMWRDGQYQHAIRRDLATPLTM